MNLENLQHDHVFSQDQRKPGESRMILVIVITAIMMIVEIAVGLLYGSMALLADGLHMGSHAVALGIAAFAYFYARKNAHNRQFNFGTGKVNALGGFTGAILLAVFVVMMAGESFHRLFEPVEISFNESIVVACVGLVVNAVCFYILGHNHQHAHHDCDHSHSTEKDHNLNAASLHVLADALTSILAIAALLAGKYYQLNWLDPAMGIVGAILIARWSVGLLVATSEVLLDKQAPEHIHNKIRNAIESQQDHQISDLHVWAIGSEMYAVEMTIISKNSQSPDAYKALLPEDLGLVHVNVEVHQHHDTAEETS